MINDEEPPTPEFGIWQLMGLGSFAVACLVAGLGLGWKVDEWRGTSPVFVLVGIALGIVFTIVGSWIKIRTFLRD